MRPAITATAPSRLSIRPERPARAAAATGHLDLERDERELWGAPVAPLGVGPLLEVDTRGPVDVPAAARRIVELAAGAG